MRLTWTPRARCDVANIKAYYGRRNPEAADRLMLKVVMFARHLEEHPNMGRTSDDKSCRLLHVSGTHYVLPYLQVSEHEIEILAVFDTRQERPDDWQ